MKRTTILAGAVALGAVIGGVYVYQTLTEPRVPTLRWRIPQDPPVRRFKIESAPVDTTPKGYAPPVWSPVGTYGVELCYGFTTRAGKNWWICSKEVPNKDLLYRVKACNDSPFVCMGGSAAGTHCTADSNCPGSWCNVDGCSREWASEVYMVCADPNNKTGCPCDLFPSASGCVS